YEDHHDFNEAFDREYEPIRLGELQLQPSRVLFYGDPEGYKAALGEFLADRDDADDEPHPRRAAVNGSGSTEHAVAASSATEAGTSTAQAGEGTETDGTTAE